MKSTLFSSSFCFGQLAGERTLTWLPRLLVTSLCFCFVSCADASSGCQPWWDPCLGPEPNATGNAAGGNWAEVAWKPVDLGSSPRVLVFLGVIENKRSMIVLNWSATVQGAARGNSKESRSRFVMMQPWNCGLQQVACVSLPPKLLVLSRE